jgi:F0F1-type ATP synthase assembly protein I
VSGDRPDDATIEAAGVSPHLVQRLRFGLRIQSLIVAAMSSLLGSLAVYLPGLMFTVVTLRKLGGDTAAFLRTATLAELGKLLLTGTFCGLVFVFVDPLAPGYFFLGMIVTLAVGWGTLIRAFS